MGTRHWGGDAPPSGVARRPKPLLQEKGLVVGPGRRSSLSGWMQCRMSWAWKRLRAD